MVANEKILDTKAEEAVREAFSILSSKVKLIIITSTDCPGCETQSHLLQELSGLTDKLELIRYDASADRDKINPFKVDKYPATIPMTDSDHRIRFYGVTAGLEFTSLLEAIIMVSTSISGLDQQMEKLVRSLGKEAHIQVLTSLTCPYCPKMVRIAHQLAFINPGIRSDMVEIAEFPDLMEKYQVKGVPRTVINETHFLDGLVPVGRFYMELLKAVDPASYHELEEALRTMSGRSKVRKADPKRDYEVIVIGGGPAGMSAALYAARKGLDVLMITKGFGGQVNYTARVDNYLGVSQVSGADMVEAFRDHAEEFEISEHLGALVTRVELDKEGFQIGTEDGRKFKGRSVIFCGGKEYKRLGIPGEERLMGKGVAFCATCDAPLFSGKKVAVIGGGNSAFTALRDLIPFVAEAHLIHRRRDFRADQALVSRVTSSEVVRVHTPFEVEEFLGMDGLEGVMIKDLETGSTSKLEVQGAFLEIGMEAKAEPLAGLVRLNEQGEVPVSKGMSTDVQGLFAAGDVTDVAEKQISIAVGQGALAALSAYEYLDAKGLLFRKAPPKEIWE